MQLLWKNSSAMKTLKNALINNTILDREYHECFDFFSSDKDKCNRKKDHQWGAVLVSHKCDKFKRCFFLILQNTTFQTFKSRKLTMFENVPKCLKTLQQRATFYLNFYAKIKYNFVHFRSKKCKIQNNSINKDFWFFIWNRFCENEKDLECKQSFTTFFMEFCLKFNFRLFLRNFTNFTTILQIWNMDRPDLMSHLS